MKRNSLTVVEEEYAMNFKADDAPIGKVVKLDKRTAMGRIAIMEFNKYLFRYFQELNSGQTGWGISFISWLEISVGWKLEGLKTFRKVGVDLED